MSDARADGPDASVISESLGLYRDHWQHFAGIALLVYVVVGLASLALTTILGIFGAVIAAVLTFVGVFWLQGALVSAVEDVRDGRVDLTIAETFEGVRPYIGRIAGAGILAGIAIVAGFILLIVPGFYLMTIWSVIVPVIVLEGEGVGTAFGRSRQLVSGHGWNVFVVIVLSWLILVVVGIVVGILASPFGDTVGAFLADVVSGAVTGPFVALVLTLLYYRLRGEPTARPSEAI